MSAATNNAAVLLLDEPTRADIVKHVHGLSAENGIAVLWAAHLIDAARAPMPGFLHPTETLDTLGLDEPESKCGF